MTGASRNPCSSVAMRLDSVFKIEFAWYWLDEKGKWIEYGKKDSEHCSATISSSELEAAFLANHNGVAYFCAGTQFYELNFQEMVQRNMHYQTKRKVSRRPRCVFFGGGHENKGRLFESSLLHEIPSSWDCSALPNIGFELVTVSNTTEEYNEIKKLFMNTMEGYTIKRLQRIQNPSLWEVFQWEREQMKKLNEEKEVEERLLFHGTSTSHLDGICANNFDWRICGTNGTLYGKGSYFARDAKKSHIYCRSNTLTNSMVVARVLVGKYVPGNSTYVLPPSRPNQPGCFYDSCVDDGSDPSIFVIFEKHQIYPAYIIEYEKAQAPSDRCVLL
ncbi:protein mono-ADP-ribosyltransferase PARP12 isoform X1 [Anolis carolinensis]|uniref:protein mono-ADP-ribosyltransferase PARP12 isoform X1 n=1 Tax=Anolis carolinensis TaxID=28377 RepID=UPI002F2B7D93